MKSFRLNLTLAIVAALMILTGCDEQLPGGELTGADVEEGMCDGIGVDRVITHIDDANVNGCIDPDEVVWRDYGVCLDSSWSWFDDDTEIWFETAPTSFWLVDIDENLCGDDDGGDDDDASGDDDDASGDDDDATGDDDDATSEPPLTGPVACPGGWFVSVQRFAFDGDENGCLTVAERGYYIDLHTCSASSDVDYSYYHVDDQGNGFWIHEGLSYPWVLSSALDDC